MPTGSSRIISHLAKKKNNNRINEPRLLKIYFQQNCITESSVLDILSDIRTENRTASRIARTEQDRTELYGSVLPVPVLRSSSEQNFGNTI